MFLRIIDRLRYRGTDAAVDGVEARELELLLAPAIAPSPGLVQRLESRIRAEPMPQVRIGTPWWLRRPVQVAVPVVVAIAVVVAWSVTRPPAPTQVSAAVLATAFAKLESVDTLRYEVDARVSPGRCSTGFNAGATDEEREELGVDRVILVQCGPDRYKERGGYDPDSGPFGRPEYAVISEQIEGGFGVGTNFEAIQADGKTYVQQFGGTWREVPQVPGGFSPSAWSPLTIMQGTAYPGLAGLRYPFRDYGSAMYHGEETLDGVKVGHYSASKPIPGTTYREEVEVWVGMDDGLPRRAILKLFYAEQDLFKDVIARAEIFSNDPESEYHGDPVVTRGPEPDSASWAELKYQFFDFDEPLDIQAPLVE